jgi:hypothetical protein
MWPVGDWVGEGLGVRKKWKLEIGNFRRIAHHCARPFASSKASLKGLSAHQMWTHNNEC